MATNKVQIQVELKGSEQVNKQLGKIEESAVDLKEGFNGVGESFKSVGDIVRSQGSPMADAFGTLGDSVGAITESVGAFKDGLAVMGETGGKAWVAMLGPLAAVISGITLAYEAYREFSGAALEAETRMEGMQDAASDTASRLEALAEEGIVLSTKALKEFTTLNIQSRTAQIASEKSIEALNTKYFNMVDAQKAVIEQQKDMNKWSLNNALSFVGLKDTQGKLITSTKEFNDALGEVTKKLKEQMELNDKVNKIQTLLTTSSEDYIENLRAEREAENELLSTIRQGSQIKNKQIVDIQERANKQSELLQEERKYRQEFNKLEDDLKRKIITDVQYDAMILKLKKSIEEKTEAQKKENKVLKENADEIKNNLDKKQAETAAYREAFSRQVADNIENISRRVTLLDRVLADSKDTATNYGKSFAMSIENMLYRTTEFTREYIKLRTEAETLREKSLSRKGTSVVSEESERLKELYKITPEFKAEVELGYKDLNDALLSIEEERITLNWQKRVEEIRGMEISNKKKKQLYAEAIQDAEYETNRLRETTYNTNYARVQDLLTLQQQEDLNNRLAQIARERQREDYNQKENQATIDQLKAKKSLNQDLLFETSQINQQIAKIEQGMQLDNMTRLLISQKDELDALKLYHKERLFILKEHNDKISIDTKNKMEEELKSIKQREHDKLREIEITERNMVNIVDQSYAQIRNLELESNIQRERNVRDFSSMFLSNEQIRANTTKQFIEEEYEANKEKIKKEINDYDLKIQKSKELIAQLEKERDVSNSMLLQYGAEGTNLLEQDIIDEKLFQEKKALDHSITQKQKAYEAEAELKKLNNQRMYQYDLEHYQEVGTLIKDFGAASSQAMIDAGVAAAFAGESISDAIRTTLRGLAQEATARALFEGAAALGSLAIGDARGATLHGNSAVAFGLAAASMGILTAAVGVPGGSSGGGGATSPSGMSQTSQAPQREEARQEAMVFNINFGNAVIYDTRAAAERAMAERVMSLGMQARRGYVPPRPRI